jgi:hypothetical protein
MFCLMDVSGSMGEREKDLAKRFYMLLHLFLKRATSASTSFSSAIPTMRRKSTSRNSSIRASRAARSSRPRSTRCWRSRRSATRPPTGTSMRRRPPTATRNPAMRGAAWNAERRHHAALPVLRLYRDSRRARDGSVRQRGFRRELWRAYRTVAERGPISPPSGISKPGRRHLPGLPRAVQEAEMPPECAARKKERASMTDACSRGGAKASRRPSLRSDSSLYRRWDFSTLDRVYKAIEEIALERTQARRLSQPDRGDLVGADARRLFLARHAADVQSLVLRQAVSRARNAVSRRLSAALAYEIVINSIPAFPICSKRTR